MIVIPMAGLSSRFRAAGYDVPKYMLEAGGRSLFEHSVRSFEAYFATEPFLFIYRDVQGTADFIAREIARMGIAAAQTVALQAPTGGQAETVMLGLERADNAAAGPLTIFNIDTIRPQFRFGPTYTEGDGCLEVFRGDGEGWSFVEPDPELQGRALRTTEKVRISDLCSTGIYAFRTTALFRDAYATELAASRRQSPELYIAPLYNHLIAQGADIRFDVIAEEDVIFSGVPSEYEAFRAGFER